MDLLQKLHERACIWHRSHSAELGLKQRQSIQVCVPLGLAKVVECPWKFVLGDWPCHLHHTSFAPGAVHMFIHGFHDFHVCTNIAFAGLVGRKAIICEDCHWLARWIRWGAWGLATVVGNCPPRTIHLFPTFLAWLGNHDSQIDIGLPYLYWPCWQLIQNNAICMVWVDWQAPQLAMHPITTTGCLFQWHNVHLHTTFTGQRAVRFDCHGFASLPVDWPCSLNQGWNNHATGVEPHSHKLVLALARTAWPKVHNGNCHFFWLAMVYMFLPPFLRLCSHRLAEGGPCDCPGLACTNQAHLQHGFSQAMHKFIVFVHGLLGHNLCRKQKSILYPDCPYKAVHCRCKQKLPAQGMLGSVTSHRSVLPKTSINSMIFNNGMQTLLNILW